MTHGVMVVYVSSRADRCSFWTEDNTHNAQFEEAVLAYYRHSCYHMRSPVNAMLILIWYCLRLLMICLLLNALCSCFTKRCPSRHMPSAALATVLVINRGHCHAIVFHPTPCLPPDFLRTTPSSCASANLSPTCRRIIYPRQKPSLKMH